jgi:hypothetical protein
MRQDGYYLYGSNMLSNGGGPANWFNLEDHLLPGSGPTGLHFGKDDLVSRQSSFPLAGRPFWAGPGRMQAVNGNVDVELTAILTRVPIDPESESYKSKGLKSKHVLIFGNG